MYCVTVAAKGILHHVISALTMIKITNASVENENDAMLFDKNV